MHGPDRALAREANDDAEGEVGTFRVEMNDIDSRASDNACELQRVFRPIRPRVPVFSGRWFRLIPATRFG